MKAGNHVRVWLVAWRCEEDGIECSADIVRMFRDRFAAKLFRRALRSRGSRQGSISKIGRVVSAKVPL